MVMSGILYLIVCFLFFMLCSNDAEYCHGDLMQYFNEYGEPISYGFCAPCCVIYICIYTLHDIVYQHGNKVNWTENFAW